MQKTEIIQTLIFRGWNVSNCFSVAVENVIQKIINNSPETFIPEYRSQSTKNFPSKFIRPYFLLRWCVFWENIFFENDASRRVRARIFVSRRFLLLYIVREVAHLRGLIKVSKSFRETGVQTISFYVSTSSHHNWADFSRVALCAHPRASVCTTCLVRLYKGWVLCRVSNWLHTHCSQLAWYLI